MRPEERDLAFLWDMREAARDVLDFIRGVTYVHFCNDKIVRYAVERRIEVIGEAARYISESFQNYASRDSLEAYYRPTKHPGA